MVGTSVSSLSQTWAKANSFTQAIKSKSASKHIKENTTALHTRDARKAGVMQNQQTMNACIECCLHVQVEILLPEFWDPISGQFGIHVGCHEQSISTCDCLLGFQLPSTVSILRSINATYVGFTFCIHNKEA
jgi:hypothetical protein